MNTQQTYQAIRTLAAYYVARLDRSQVSGGFTTGTPSEIVRCCLADFLAEAMQPYYTADNMELMRDALQPLRDLADGDTFTDNEISRLAVRRTLIAMITAHATATGGICNAA